MWFAWQFGRISLVKQGLVQAHTYARLHLCFYAYFVVNDSALFFSVAMARQCRDACVQVVQFSCTCVFVYGKICRRMRTEKVGG